MAPAARAMGAHALVAAAEAGATAVAAATLHAAAEDLHVTRPVTAVLVPAPKCPTTRSLLTFQIHCSTTST